MDSAWIASWLAYVHFDKENAPAPGPCRNNRLITWDYQQGKYVGRFGLLMAVKEHAGDYRRVTKETWDKYCLLYPGSGPAITMLFNASKMDETGTGAYDCSTWNIIDPPAPPENKDKKVKKRLLAHISGKGKEEEKSKQEKPAQVAPERTFSEESKLDDTPFRSIRDNTISINSTSGSGYIKLGAETEEVRASTSSQEGLIESDRTRQSSVQGGNKSAQEIEDVFFGKD